ncbi:MAG TPA: NAD(P)H-dependent oxidoreductase [Steroidobacteraceae bacterium]|nr:NAD(P)H-dependent oxidoreductase [Steroidobacteraceae bacterium]
MARRIVIIDGHPDATAKRYIHALAKAYEKGAVEAGHEVRMIRVATLGIPGIRSNEDFRDGKPPAAVDAAQQHVAWADHLVIIYPLWLGSMPGMLKSFFEQLLRPGFAFAPATDRGMPRKLLKGRSARIIVTMGMPALFYRWYFRAHSLKSLERNILAFCGIQPVRASLVGMVEGMSQLKREQWLAKVERLGRLAK